MSGSLQGPISRLGRAADHYRTLKNEFHFGVDHKRRPVTIESHRNGLEYRFRVGEIEEIAPEWPLLLGEAFYNLRSALDHLVYEMHVRRWRGNVPERVVRNSQFPIYSKPRKQKGGGSDLPTKEWKEIGTLAKRERAAIEWLQPYKGRNAAPNIAKSLVGQHRAVLRDIAKLNNWDKHRELHLAHTAVVSVYRPNIEKRFGLRQFPAFGVPLRSHAYVDTWTFKIPPPPENVEMHHGIYSTVGIDPRGDRIQALPNLGRKHPWNRCPSGAVLAPLSRTGGSSRRPERSEAQLGLIGSRRTA